MNKRILIVDDDRNVLDELKMIFTHQRYQVDICDYTINMEELFMTEKPDLVIAGFSKYEINGNKLSTHLSKKGTSHIPVIFIAGDPLTEKGADGKNFFFMSQYNLFLLTCKVKSMINNIANN